MNLAEFQEQLENNSVKDENLEPVGENCKRRIDGKWVLGELARRYYGIKDYKSMSKTLLQQRIIRNEGEYRYFTNENNYQNKTKPFEITISGDNEFKPYTINIHVRDKETHDHLVSDLKEAEDALCPSADWILHPLMDALGIDY